MRRTRKVVMANKATRAPLLEFDSAKEAARCLNRKPAGVMSQCKTHSLSAMSDVYFRYSDDFDPMEEFRTGPGCPTYARHGNKVRVFYSINKMMEAFRVSEPTASNALRKGELMGIEVGYLNRGLEALHG